ncbi:response regulator [Modestobacter lacusdianchii]
MTSTAASFADINDLIGKLAWPLVVLLLVFMFRRPLNALLSRDHVEATLPGGISLIARNPAAAAEALQTATEQKSDGVSPDVAEVEIAAATHDLIALGRAPRLLWVDDRPSNNRYEATALEALGITVEIAQSTTEALAKMSARGPFDAIISDMGRPPDPRAGYTLLDALRQAGDLTPFVIYAGSNQPEHFDEAVRHGAVGSTNHPTELIRLVRRALRAGAARSTTSK